MRETNKRKQIPNTIANDRNRFRKKLSTAARPGLGLTSQIVSNASCNWANTPEAAKSSTMTLRIVARRLGCPSRPGESSTVRTASAPTFPTRSANSPMISRVAASRPKIAPAIGKISTTIGARARTV